MEAECLGIRKKVLELVPYIEDDQHSGFSIKINTYEKALKMAKEETDCKSWDSSLMNSTEYNPKTQELIIEFSNGTKYLYEGFADSLYKEFLAAESKGQFFVSKIRKEYLSNEKAKRL